MFVTHIAEVCFWTRFTGECVTGELGLGLPRGYFGNSLGVASLGKFGMFCDFAGDVWNIA